MKLKRKIRILVMGFFQVLLGKGGAFHAEEERLLRVYYNTAGHRIEKLKTGVVMMIDGRTMHGGLSDRLRGICSVYYWCKLHSIPFYIHFEYPFHLADYLLPASYDWTISDDEISILPPHKSPSDAYVTSFTKQIA